MASFRRFGSRLTKKKTTKLRHSIVRSMTPMRRRMNESIAALLCRWQPARHFFMCLSPGCPGEVSLPLPELRSLSFVQPDLVDLQFEGLVHEEALHIVRVVSVKLAPERLDNDARILKDRLDLLHHLLALAGVGDGEGGIDFLVEVRVRIGRLVPGFP